MTAKPYPADNSWAMRINRWTLWMSKKYLTILLILIGTYAFLPILAPVLMRLGLTTQGEWIYSAYSGMCHQFAYRSWFLFGEQPAYPRASVQFPGLKPYEDYATNIGQITVLPPAYAAVQMTSAQRFDLTSKFFLGSPTMGWKTAICQRDVAIYVALFFSGVIYSIPVVRRHLRPVPWWLYLLLGLAPIGLDGFSQLLSYPLPPLWNEGLWPLRETTPIFRTLTGVLFGVMNGWLAFPYLEESARQVIDEVTLKFKRREARLQGITVDGTGTRAD